jgi:hypothetical protein
VWKYGREESGIGRISRKKGEERNDKEIRINTIRGEPLQKMEG